LRKDVPIRSPSTVTSPESPSEEKVNLERICYVYYTHKNFEHESQFLQDFGFTPVKTPNAGQPNETIYYRGYSTEPWLYCSKEREDDAFGGTAFVVESGKDLELAGKIIPTANKIYELVDAPGGGECVTVKDPTDRSPVHLAYGKEQREMSEEHEQRLFNFVGGHKTFPSLCQVACID